MAEAGIGKTQGKTAHEVTTSHDFRTLVSRRWWVSAATEEQQVTVAKWATVAFGVLVGGARYRASSGTCRPRISCRPRRPGSLPKASRT